MRIKGLLKKLGRAARAPRPKPNLDQTLIEQTDQLNEKAELYWQTMTKDDASRLRLLDKPLHDLGECASTFYRLGLVLAEARLGVGLTVVDLGAGSCWLSSILNKLRCRTISLDVSHTALSLGEELFRRDPRHDWTLNPQFVSYDGYHLPLPDESVDRVISFDAFHHIPNQLQIIGEIYRVLKSGGRAIFSEPGEGHDEAPSSKMEVQVHGVLENNIILPDLMEKAAKVGFSKVLVKPYPHPSAITFSESEYRAFMAGNGRQFPLDVIRNYLRTFLTFTLLKGDDRYDSRAPNDLQAALHLRQGDAEPRAACQSAAKLQVNVKNTGDTVWLCGPDVVGGYVSLGGHLYNDKRELLSYDFLRCPLPRDVKPNESCLLTVEWTVPQAPGQYVLELDMVDEQVRWFKESGSPTLEIIMVAF
ncbi:MAG: class I SAM-dependent methyltransferase [Acidobacteria bacterium]|nr:class I SAM-dependent methyltransferase [Acidobacteriota bacterium]MBI3656103.1 class I SAM-dependent methyltransferase [Acidobacteriota bacterium]